MFRLADRIVVLRHGRVVTEVLPSEVHPDDVVALVSGQAVDSSARLQLTRLHGLAGRLVASDPSSSLSLILSALGAALGSERLAIHLLEDGYLVRAASLGMPEALLDAWARLPVGAAGGPVGARRRAAGARSSRRTCGPRRLLAGLRQPRPAGEGRELLVGARARARRAARRDHRVPRDTGQAAPRRPGPRRAVRRVRRERHRAGPAARRGDRAQPAA